MLTQQDKQYIKNIIEKISEQKLSKFLTRAEFLEKFDQIMFELKAIREEHVVISYHVQQHTDLLDNHELRITSLENLKTQSN